MDLFDTRVTVEAEGQSITIQFNIEKTMIDETEYNQTVYQDAGWFAEAVEMARLLAFKRAHGRHLATTIEGARVFWTFADGELTQILSERIATRILEAKESELV